MAHKTTTVSAHPVKSGEMIKHPYMGGALVQQPAQEDGWQIQIKNHQFFMNNGEFKKTFQQVAGRSYDDNGAGIYEYIAAAVKMKNTL